MSGPRITPIGHDGEFGWLIHGAWTRAEAIAHLLASDVLGEDHGWTAERLAAEVWYEPGYWRWVPARKGEEYKRWLHHARRGRGAFPATYLERRS